MDDLDPKIRSALRELDQQSDQGAANSRHLSAERIAAVAKNRNRRKNLSVTVLTVAMTAILWNWSHSTNDSNTIADVPPAAASPTLAQSISQLLEESRALRKETERLLADSRSLTTRAVWNDPINDAAHFSVAHASIHIDNGSDTERARRELKAVVESFPNTFAAKEAKRMLTQLPKPNRKQPSIDTSGRLPEAVDFHLIATR